MRNILLKNNEIIFDFTYNKSIITYLKKIEAKYNPNNKTWSLFNDPSYYNKIEDVIKKYNFTLNNSMLKISRFKELLYPSDTKHQINDFLSKYTIKTCEKQEYNKLYKFTPRDYQWTAAIMMLVEEKVLVGDDMGIGKSIEALMAVEIGYLYPCLIVCPNSVKYNWVKYIKQWMYRKYSIIEGKKTDNFKNEFVIVNYEKLGKKEGKYIKANESLKQNWGSVIVDESHFVKNSKSIRSKSLSQILKTIPFRFFLTGTAATIRPIDIFNQLLLLGREDIVGNWNKFVMRYCGGHKTFFGIDTSGATNLGELKLKLSTSCYIRREKRDVLEDLPDIQTTILEIDITNRKEYKIAEDEFVYYLKSNFSNKETLKKLRAEVIVKLGILKKVSAIGKLSATFEWIDNFLESGNKLVIFTCTNKVIDSICDRYKCNKINGSVSIKKRQKYIEDFISNIETNLLPINIKAGGTGIDGLQEVCSDVLIAEWPDIPGLEDQAISRIDRSGQKFSINVYKTLAKDTIEEKLQEDLINKKMITDAINKGQSIVMEDNLVENIFDYYIK